LADHIAANTGYFVVQAGSGGSVLLPQPSARSQWGGDRPQIRGMATSGALARAVEQAAGRLDGDTTTLRPVRWTLDLLRPAAMQESEIGTTLVRRGRRICLIEAALIQNSKPVAKATALFLAAGGAAHGDVWSPADTLTPPPTDMRPSTAEPRLYFSESAGWTSSPTRHQNADRKQIWHFPVPVIVGEPPTPFQQAPMTADLASLVSNWGAHGLEFINADITLALARPPSGLEVGLAAEQRATADGIAVGTATVFDRQGVIGTATVAALANGASAVDPRRRT
jgi:Thioesterase-like superfamily